VERIERRVLAGRLVEEVLRAVARLNEAEALVADDALDDTWNGRHCDLLIDRLPQRPPGGPGTGWIRVEARHGRTMARHSALRRLRT